MKRFGWGMLGAVVVLTAVVALVRREPPPEAGGPVPGPRLLVLSPAVSIMLQDIGAGALIVGRHDYDDSLPSVPPAGSQAGIDYEALIALRPDRVLIEWGDRPLPDRLVSLADTNGWALESFRLDTLESIARSADALQRSYGDPADEPMSARLERAWARSDKPLASVGRVLLLGDAIPPAALGPKSFHDEILRRVGGTPALDRGDGWVEIDSEDLIALDPDAIVLIDPRSGGEGIGAVGADALEQLGVIATLDIAAVRHRRVAVLIDRDYQKPSTAMGDFARDLRALLERWAEDTP